MNDVHVAYFYCAYNDATSQEARNVVGSWISQIPPALANITEAASKVREMTAAELEPALTKASDSHSILLILDAINESFEARELAETIVRLTTTSENIKCLVSTTPHTNAVKETFITPHLQVYMDTDLVLHDIRAYITAQVRSHLVLSRISEEEFTNALIPKSEGMFRWIDCQMDFLRGQLTPRAVRKALQDLPGTVDDTYILLLGRVPDTGRQIVRDALLWLSFSHRPLSLKELCEAVIVEEGESEIDNDCRLSDPELLLSLCQGLVVRDETTDMVALAHGSIKAFVAGSNIQSTPVAYFALDEDDSTRVIFRKCLTYLLLRAFQGGCGLYRTVNDMYNTYPMLDYAAQKWPIHAKACRLQHEELDLLRTFFLTQKANVHGGNFTFWVSCLRPTIQFHPLKASEPLYYAASFGLTAAVEMLLNEGLINCSDSARPWYVDHLCGRNRSTALQVACYRGHEDVVDLLLRAGADPNPGDRVGIRCVDWALQRGYRNIAAKLKAAGARTEVNLEAWSGEKSDDKDDSARKVAQYTKQWRTARRR